MVWQDQGYTFPFYDPISSILDLLYAQGWRTFIISTALPGNV